MNMVHYKSAHAVLLLLLLVCSVSLSSLVFAECHPDVLPLLKPDQIYVDHGDGTVTDIETGLMWMKCSWGQSGADCQDEFARKVSWKEALETAQSANLLNDGSGFLGYNDWRLPNHKELASLADTACAYPAINSSLFPGVPSNEQSNFDDAYYWSASSYAGLDNSAWTSNFGLGHRAPQPKELSNYVRLVRSSQ